MAKISIHKNMSVADAKRMASSLGIEVKQPRRNSELVFIHPKVGRVRVSGKGRRTPQPLVVFFRKVKRQT